MAQRMPICKAARCQSDIGSDYADLEH